MRSIDVAAIIIATADFDDETERQTANFAAVTAAAAAAAAAFAVAAAAADDFVAVLDVTNEAIKNTRAKNAAVAPSFALLVQAAVVILS
jgi:hypothetical protein